jgi:predicted nucleic acid-binding protein
MTFADIPQGASVFVDANTFVYHFAPHPVFRAACGSLLLRAMRREISASTSLDVQSDVAHRVMTMEAMTGHSWPIAGIAQRLRRHPDMIKSLSRFRRSVDAVPRFGIQIFLPPASIVSMATAVSQQYGLLSGDALIVATMQQFGVSSIASHDADFDRVPGIVRYAPV